MFYLVGIFRISSLGDNISNILSRHVKTIAVFKLDLLALEFRRMMCYCPGVLLP